MGWFHSSFGSTCKVTVASNPAAFAASCTTLKADPTSHTVLAVFAHCASMEDGRVRGAQDVRREGREEREVVETAGPGIQIHEPVTGKGDHAARVEGWLSRGDRLEARAQGQLRSQDGDVRRRRRGQQHAQPCPPGAVECVAVSD